MPLRTVLKMEVERLQDAGVCLVGQHNLLTAFAAMGDTGLEDWMADHADFDRWHHSLAWMADYDLTSCLSGAIGLFQETARQGSCQGRVR